MNIPQEFEDVFRGVELTEDEIRTLPNVEGVSAQKAAAPGRADREREVERCRRRKNCWRSSSGCWWRWAGGTAPTWRRQLRRGGPGPRRE